jgi:beta-hydroxylase
MFYDPEKFGFTEKLERNWQTIYEEYLTVQNELIDWYERGLYDAGWKVFGLFNFPQGQAIEANAKRCPYTTWLVHTYIAGHGAVGFSVLKPMTKIRPHQGYAGSYLRCHLGLSIPAGDCALRVKGNIRRWEEGRILIFDDRATHEAWNLTSEDRVVLLIDFVPPTLRSSEAGEGEGITSGSADEAP